MSRHDRRLRPAGASADVIPLGTLDAHDVARAGGKATRLGVLLGMGFPVPDGFVVTTDAWQRAGGRPARDSSAHATTRPSRAPSDERDITPELADFDGPEAMAMPEDLQAEITHAYARLGGGRVAVRSSATSEDLPSASSAGQHHSSLNVAGAEAVCDAVRHCWASLWTPHAISYRRRHGLDDRSLRIAVLVQRMVDPDYAGVLLTANPVTGARDEYRLDVSRGSGEAVASGRVTPDHYILDPAGRVREHHPGRSGNATDGRPADGAAASAEPERLPGQVIAELARLAAAITRGVGQPQDIEWAYAGERIWILQARPMTAVPPAPLELNGIQRITGPMLAEMLPTRPYPLDMSAWTLPAPGRMVARMIDEILGLRVDFADMLPEVDEVVARFVPPVPRPTPRMLTAPIRVGTSIWRHDPDRWRQDPRLVAFQARVAALAARDPAVASWPELVQTPRHLWAMCDLVTDLRIRYLPRAAFDLLRLRLLVTLLGSPSSFGALLPGAPTRTREVNRALAAVAARVRQDPDLRAAFVELDAETLASRVQQDPRMREVRETLAELLERYGHRETTTPLLISSPTWRDAPAVVLGLIQALVDDSVRPSRAEDHAPAARLLRDLLRHPVVRWTRSQRRVLRAVQAGRTALAIREDTHFSFTRAVPVLRATLLEMGRRLTDAEVLDQRDDVWHLHLSELAALPDPWAITAPQADRLRGAVRRRSATRAERAGSPLISTASLFPSRASTGTDALVTGTPAATGRVTGHVRIIRGPGEFGRLRRGDILVCPYTNPAWTPLFQRAAAVVVDTGGIGSHAAIVAREYGIPTIMGAGDATTTLTDGEWVRVDGDHGQVTRPRSRADGSRRWPSPA